MSKSTITESYSKAIYFTGETPERGDEVKTRGSKAVHPAYVVNTHDSYNHFSQPRLLITSKRKDGTDYDRWIRPFDLILIKRKGRCFHDSSCYIGALCLVCDGQMSEAEGIFTEFV
jgi:hypothetical protein